MIHEKLWIVCSAAGSSETADIFAKSFVFVRSIFTTLKRVKLSQFKPQRVTFKLHQSRCAIRRLFFVAFFSRALSVRAVLGEEQQGEGRVLLRRPPWVRLRENVEGHAAQHRGEKSAKSGSGASYCFVFYVMIFFLVF